MTEILNGFLEHRVVCNLLFACKHLYNSQEKDEKGSEKALLEAITQMLAVVSQLVHQDNSAFITQFGEGVCVLNAYDVLGKCLVNQNSSPALQTNVIVILSQVSELLSPFKTCCVCICSVQKLFWNNLNSSVL